MPLRLPKVLLANLLPSEDSADAGEGLPPEHRGMRAIHDARAQIGLVAWRPEYKCDDGERPPWLSFRKVCTCYVWFWF